MYNDNDYLSIAALSGRLGLSEAYLKEQANAGRIPFLIVKGRRKFNVGAVRAALAKMEQTGTTSSSSVIESSAFKLREAASG